MAIVIVLAFITPFFGFSQDNCSKYYPMEEGAHFQYTMYNKKGKADGVTDYTVTKVSDAGGLTTATMHITFTDKKGEEIYETDYEFACDGSSVKIDYESLIPETMIQQFKDMEYEITGSDIQLPNNLSEGQELEDANVNIKISMAGMNMDMGVNMINRKVEKAESVTTPAGTFDTLVIYSENETATMGMNRTFPSRVWLAEGVGMVKQESYDRKGNLTATTQLTEFSM